MMKNLIYSAIMMAIFSLAGAQPFTSPRATAIGAYTAISNHAYGVDWNLAATAFSNANFEIALASEPFENDIIEDFRLLWRPWAGHVFAFRQTPGLGVRHIIQKLPLVFDPNDLTPLNLLRDLVYEEDLMAGYAVRPFSQLAVGLDLRRQIYSNIFTSSRFWSLNLTASYQLSEKVRFGLIARNIHNFHYEKPINRIGFLQGDTLAVYALDFESFQHVFTKPERRFDLGAAFQPLDRLLLAIDIYSDAGFGIGTEWQVFDKFLVRAGLSHKSDGLFKSENVTAFSTGLGLAFDKLHLDLASYFPHGERASRIEYTDAGLFRIYQAKDMAILASALFIIQ